MLTLAQSLVPDLDEPSALAYYTLENPYPAVVVGVLAALGVFYLLVRLGKSKQALVAGGALLALAAGVFALAQIVETSREEVMRQTREFVDAAAAGREAAVAALLTRDARLRVADSPISIAREPLLALVRRVGTRNPIASYSINEVRAGREEAASLTAQVQVSASAAGGGGPLPTWWQLEWTRGDDGEWRLREIVWLTLGPSRPGASLLTGW